MRPNLEPMQAMSGDSSGASGAAARKTGAGKGLGTAMMIAEGVMKVKDANKRETPQLSAPERRMQRMMQGG